MTPSLALSYDAEFFSEDIEAILLLWKLGCSNLGDNLHEDECPSCFSGNIRTVYSQAGARLQCASCGVIGTIFEPQIGR